MKAVMMRLMIPLVEGVGHQVIFITFTGVLQ